MFRYYKKYAPYLFLLPAAIVLLVFFFIPFFQTVYFSFFEYSHNIYSPIFIELDNYKKLLHSPVFYKVMVNTFLYLFIAVPILAIVPLFIAILINQKLRFFLAIICHIFSTKINHMLDFLLLLHRY